MKIEKTNKKLQQIYFGKIIALQPKKVKKNLGTDGTPLFEAQHKERDQNQLDIFTGDKIEKS